MSFINEVIRWLHIGIRNLKGKQRRQVMRYENGKITKQNE